MSVVLRLVEDRFAHAARVTLPAAPRVLYVRDGDAAPSVAGAPVRTAWHGAGAVVVDVEEPTAVLRFELVADAGATTVVRATAGETRDVLEHAMDVDPTRGWLMRCDRVDFAPGGVALPHGHKGGGIRCLLAGALEVTVGDRPPRLMQPGDAWFESGREPVLARASADAPTAFVRVSILPREIRGQSSIVYVDPADASRGRPRRYTVYVDEPIELPGA